MKTFRKVYAYIIRLSLLEGQQLLVYTAPDGSLRFPGGMVDNDEDVLAGLRRELSEETGISEFKVLRELGVHRYYKPDVDKHVERHDYLLHAASLPDEFSFTVQSRDKDDGMIFDYRWIGIEHLHQLDWEFRDYITPAYIPEFFAPGGV